MRLNGLWALGRRTFFCFAALLLFAASALGGGAILPKPFVFSSEFEEAALAPSAMRRVLVLSNAIHSDIALPAEPDVLKEFEFVSNEGLELDYPGVHWIVVGWGGRSFYIETPTWSHLKPGPVLKSFTWDQSVMHVRRAGQIRSDVDSVLAIELSEEDFTQLLFAIKGSFESELNEKPASIPGAAYNEHDLFFPANGGFNAFMGCNVWTAKMLRVADKTTGTWTPLPKLLTWSLKFHNRDVESIN